VNYIKEEWYDNVEYWCVGIHKFVKNGQNTNNPVESIIRVLKDRLKVVHKGVRARRIDELCWTLQHRFNMKYRMDYVARLGGTRVNTKRAKWAKDRIEKAKAADVEVTWVDRANGVADVPSFSKEGVVYRVANAFNTEACCSCEDAKFQTCHLQAPIQGHFGCRHHV
jgi:hypothetical protein